MSVIHVDSSCLSGRLVEPRSFCLSQFSHQPLPMMSPRPRLRCGICKRITGNLSVFFLWHILLFSLVSQWNGTHRCECKCDFNTVALRTIAAGTFDSFEKESLKKKSSKLPIISLIWTHFLGIWGAVETDHTDYQGFFFFPFRSRHCRWKRG